MGSRLEPVISFNNTSKVACGSGRSAWLDQGMVLYALGGVSFFPENGTAYLQATLGDSLRFSFLNGSVFNLLSVDLAEYSTGFATPLTVPFVGYRSDGSVVNTSFTTDGIIDGTGPLADFQTFHFGPEFSNLLRVEIPASGWALDNLVVAVPEPGTWALIFLGAAFGGAGYVKRRLKGS